MYFDFDDAEYIQIKEALYYNTDGTFPLFYVVRRNKWFSLKNKYVGFRNNPEHDCGVIKEEEGFVMLQLMNQTKKT